MRYVITAIALLLPLCVRGEDRKLDPRKRAKSESLTWGFDATEAEFRKMQRSYHPEQFDVWKKKISHLRAGMTEKQLMQALHAREVSARTESTSTY
jgi:hypothetical protein